MRHQKEALRRQKKDLSLVNEEDQESESVENDEEMNSDVDRDGSGDQSNSLYSVEIS